VVDGRRAARKTRGMARPVRPAASLLAGAALSALAAACQVQPHPVADRAPRRAQPPEVACNADGDCELVDQELAGPDACCPGCTSRAGNHAGVARFRRECAAAPPTRCPGLDCRIPAAHAVCRSGRCAAEPGAAAGAPALRRGESISVDRRCTFVSECADLVQRCPNDAGAVNCPSPWINGQHQLGVCQVTCAP
jgi:hypothetical protein